MTKAQIEVIKDLLAWRYAPGSRIVPTEVYPGRNNQDNAKRRTLRRLRDQGWLDGDRWEVGVYRMTQRLVDAYQEWWRTRGFRDPNECNVLLP